MRTKKTCCKWWIAVSKSILVKTGAVIMLIIGSVWLILWIITERFSNLQLEEKSAVAILAFIGVLATFVVISNFAQVTNIRDEFQRKTRETNKFIQQTQEKIEKIKVLKSELEEMKSQIKEFDTKTAGYLSKTDLYNIYKHLAEYFFSKEKYKEAFCYSIRQISMENKEQQPTSADFTVCKYEKAKAKLNFDSSVSYLVKMIRSEDAQKRLLDFLGLPLNP